MANYDEVITTKLHYLLSVMRKRVSAEDLARIEKAFEFAKEAHKKHVRKSGEPYIIHPLDVALIVATEMELGANPVIAAFCHDIIEDTEYTGDDLERMFGKDVRFLVEAVTRKNETEQLSQLQNFKKILTKMNYDVRGVLLKVADRLNNMRTLAPMPMHKKVKIAGETIFFYAPIANYLGLYHIKSELENLSFRYRCPSEFALLHKSINEHRSQNQKKVEKFAAEVKECLAQNGIEVEIEVRYRTEFSIHRKLKEQDCDFSHVEGTHYVRIIYSNYAMVNDVRLNEKEMAMHIYSVLTEKFREFPGSVKNYINSPKENGYQSLQLKLLCKDEKDSKAVAGHWQEVHISSERMVRNARLGCVAERSEANANEWVKEKTKTLREAFTEVSNNLMADAISYLLPSDNINVFTSKGEEKFLPEGATALDFAFVIHTEVGLKAKYAYINGKLSSLRTKLKRGDCVVICKSDDATPNKEWLKHVKLLKSRNALIHYFENLPKLELIRCEHCHPLPGDEVVVFENADKSKEIHKGDCVRAIERASSEGEKIVKELDTFEFKEDEKIVYPVRISIKAIDRYHLLTEIIDCVTNRLKLPITSISTQSEDYIGTCIIDFPVHSVHELNAAIASLNAIDGVEEVSRIDVE